MIERRFANGVRYFIGAVCFSLFPDGSSVALDVERGDNDWYRGVARWAGYGEDWRAYAVEHDLTHHLLAEALGWPCSRALHRAAHGLPGDAITEAEERVVNAVQALKRALRPPA